MKLARPHLYLARTVGKSGWTKVAARGVARPAPVSKAKKAKGFLAWSEGAQPQPNLTRTCFPALSRLSVRPLDPIQRPAEIMAELKPNSAEDGRPRGALRNGRRSGRYRPPNTLTPASVIRRADRSRRAGSCRRTSGLQHQPRAATLRCRNPMVDAGDRVAAGPIAADYNRSGGRSFPS
jgi:hypothetical protein